jgi:hypothetical protein
MCLINPNVKRLQNMKQLLKFRIFLLVLISTLISGAGTTKLPVKIKVVRYYDARGQNYSLNKFEYDKQNRLSSVSVFVDLFNEGMPLKPENSLKFSYSKNAAEMKFYDGDTLYRISKHTLNKNGYSENVKILSPKKDSVYDNQDFKYNESGNLTEISYSGSKYQFAYKDGNRISCKYISPDKTIREETLYEYDAVQKDLAGLGSTMFIYGSPEMYMEGFTFGKGNTKLIKAITKPSGERWEYVYQINMAGYVTKMDVTITNPGQEEARQYSVKMEY